MKAVPTEIPGVIIVEPDVHRDERGYFAETYSARKFRELGIPDEFVQDNQSFSARGTLRGLHAQSRRPQSKLVRVLSGEIFDVAVDARRSSPTFKRWVGVVLSAESFKQLFVPAGFLHGFCVLSERAEVAYKCGDYYDPGGEIGIVWNDPDLGIRWPIEHPILSPKDRAWPRLADAMDRLPG
jgi:dTDP-4-dehydrorhamnose 3,5-epimerase